MPLWILGALGWLRKAAAGVLPLAGRYPWQTACIALLCLSGWLWHGWDGADAKLKDCSDGRKADRAAYVAAQDQAKAKALAAKAAAEKTYTDLAGRIDTDAQQAHDSAMADAERFIAAHRVRSQAIAGSGSGPATAAKDHSPGDGQGSGPAPELDVAVTAADVRICTTNTLQAEAARQWALGLEAATKP